MSIFGKLDFGKHSLHPTCMFHTFLCCLAFFKNHKCVLFCNLKKWDRERAWEGWRKRERETASQPERRFLFHALCHQPCLELPCWASWKVRPLGQGFGAPALPLSLFTPIRRGTLASYVFVRIKWDKSSQKALSTIKLFQIQEIIIIVRVHLNLQSLFSRRAFTRLPPPPSAASTRCFSREGDGVGPSPAPSFHPGPSPAASQQSLAVPWTFSVGSISSSGTTCCCANRARGRAKQRNMCAANHPPITGAGTRPGEGPARAL